MATKAKKPTRAHASKVLLPKPVTRALKHADVFMLTDDKGRNVGTRAVRDGALVFPRSGEPTGEAMPAGKVRVIGRCQNGWAPAGARSDAERAHAQAKRDERKAKKADNAQADTQALRDEVKALKAALADLVKALG